MPAPEDVARRNRTSEGCCQAMLGAAMVLLLVQPCAALAVEDIKDACTFFASGRGNIGSGWTWGPWHICDTSGLTRWIKAAGGQCQDCATGRYVCNASDILSIHTFHWPLPRKLAGLAYLFKSYLMTQPLHKTRLTLWADPSTGGSDPLKGHPAAAFFKRYKPYIQVKRLPPWDELLRGTPLEGHPFWSNKTAVHTRIYTTAGYTDVLRLIILHNYGGVWLDTDMVLLQDITPVTLHVGYQFYMRWNNNHVLYLKQRSPLARRILAMVRDMAPVTDADAKGFVDKVCKPKGYMTAHPAYGWTDIYNMCVLMLIHKDYVKGGDPDDILFSQPLGWWDTDWPGCLDSHNNADPSKVKQVMLGSLALHSRHLKSPNAVPGSALARAADAVTEFFKLCTSLRCIPKQGLPLLTYADVIAGMRAVGEKHWRRRLDRRLLNT